MPRKSYYQQRSDDMQILIKEVKVKNNLTNEGVAKAIGMPLNSFSKMVHQPGRFRCDQLWLLEKLAGRARDFT